MHQRICPERTGRWLGSFCPQMGAYGDAPSTKTIYENLCNLWIKILSPISVFLLLVLNSCSVGPDYKVPSAEIPATYKELTPEDAVIAKAWKPAEPKDATKRGSWWEIYQDLELNNLEKQVNISNQNVIEAEANYRAAIAAVRQTRSGYYPTVNLAPSASYSGTSKNATNNPPLPSHNSHFDFNAPIEASYMLDVWGSVRRAVESSSATAQSTEALLESARLTYQGQLAQDYFSLRGLDTERELLTSTVEDYEKDLSITQNLYNQGVSAKLDLYLAQTQLETSKAQLADVSLQRSQLEHAIAILMGKAPTSLSLPEKTLDVLPPKIPIGIPSALLERRPDVASAERQMAAANALIGVATAGYYPTIELSGSGGFEAYHLAQLFSWPSLAWSVGESLTQPISNGGKTHAQVEEARANYDAAVASYRQAILTALQQVEDNLVALKDLETEAGNQEKAVADAKKSVDILINEYKSGTTSYLNVLTEKITESTNEINATNVQIRRMVASVALIQALGGGWDVSKLPTTHTVSVIPEVKNP